MLLYIDPQVNLKMSLRNLRETLSQILIQFQQITLFLTVVLGDFNAKSNLWYKNDKTTNEGFKIDGIASQCGLHQLINEPTHLTRNASSRIDLIFTSQPNLVMESGVHSSLHENCHHQMTFAKFNLKIYYPPPYEQEVWHYQKANSENISKKP